MNFIKKNILFYKSIRNIDIYSLRSCVKISKKIIPLKLDESFIESDVEKLCNYVCINYFLNAVKVFKKDLDDSVGPAILEDSNYPNWLFELDLRSKQKLENMDPKVDGWAFWEAYKERQIEQQSRFEDLKYRYIYLQRSPSIKKNKEYCKFKYI